jgi:hypothetical protein
MGWLTILLEIFGGLAVLLGELVPLVNIPTAAVLLVAIFTVHLPYGFSSIKLQAVTAAGAQFGPPGFETDLLYLACLAALVLGAQTAGDRKPPETLADPCEAIGRVNRPDVPECLRADIAAREGRCLVLPRSPPPALRLLGADGAAQPARRGRLERYAQVHQIDVVPFRPGERKDEVMTERLKRFDDAEGVVFIGKA